MSGGRVGVSGVDDQPIDIGVTSIFGAETRKGLVELTIGGARLVILPAKAREIAGLLLECAGAAEGDEALMMALERSGMTAPRARQVLIAQRLERDIIERRARAEAIRQVAEDQWTGSDDDVPDPQ